MNKPIKPDLLEYVPCNLCGADDFRHVINIRQWNLVKCNNCSFIYVNPRLRRDVQEDSYDNQTDFSSDIHFSGDLEEYYRKGVHDKAVFYHSQLDSVEELIVKGKVLDVGCGPGTFLKVAKAREWDAYGTEIGSWAGETTEKFGIPVFIGTLKEAKFPDNHFDMVYSSAVLEHLWDPLGELREMNRILKPGGILMSGNVPNFHALLCRLGRLDEWKLGNNLPPAHNNYFTCKTMEAMVGKAGFSTIWVRSYGLDSRVKAYLTGRRKPTAAVSGKGGNDTGAAPEPVNQNSVKLESIEDFLTIPLPPRRSFAGRISKSLVASFLELTGTGVCLEVVAAKE
jgi:SAM-dependent methyltransferase